jgi:hypothetical protein
MTNCKMDPASAVVCEGLDPTEPRTYATLSKSSNVLPTTLWYRAMIRYVAMETLHTKCF